MWTGETKKSGLTIAMEVNTNDGFISITGSRGLIFISTTIYPTTKREDTVDILTKAFKAYITNQLDTEFPEELRNTWEFNKRLEK